ncbi:MAG: hypothetical protein J0H19_25470 [Rhodospirillales bacterium]|nr:hypothetical protein [Rhodospirillales bacterium]MBN8929956.1 hypothetical protein [Rhodospirillales bacterium]
MMENHSMPPSRSSSSDIEAVAQVYKAIGLPAPRVVWALSPLACCLARAAVERLGAGSENVRREITVEIARHEGTIPLSSDRSVREALERPEGLATVLRDLCVPVGRALGRDARHAPRTARAAISDGSYAWAVDLALFGGMDTWPRTDSAVVRGHCWLMRNASLYIPDRDICWLSERPVGEFWGDGWSVEYVEGEKV